MVKQVFSELKFTPSLPWSAKALDWTIYNPRKGVVIVLVGLRLFTYPFHMLGETFREVIGDQFVERMNC